MHVPATSSPCGKVLLQDGTFVFHPPHDFKSKVIRTRAPPQFTCAQIAPLPSQWGRFQRNKRFKPCNPAIPSLSLKLSIDCFDEAFRQLSLLKTRCFSCTSKQSANIVLLPRRDARIRRLFGPNAARCRRSKQSRVVFPRLSRTRSLSLGMTVVTRGSRENWSLK